MKIYNNDDEEFDTTRDYTSSDLGYGIANTNRKRKIFTPYEGAAEAWQPERKNMDAYEEHIRNQPEEGPVRTRDKLLGALVAGLSAAGGAGMPQSIHTGESVRDRSYNSALEHWKLKGSGLGELAQLEERRNRDQQSSLSAQNRYLKDAMDIEMRKGNYASLEADRTADNDRQKAAQEEIKSYHGQQASDRETTARQRAEGLRLEGERLKDSQARTGLLKNKPASTATKVSSPATKERALKIAHGKLLSKNPWIEKVLADQTNNPEYKKAKIAFMAARDRLAEDLISKNEIPEADELQAPEEEEEPTLWERMFGK